MSPEIITFLQAVIVAAITAGGTVWGISIKNNKDRAVHDAVEAERFKRLEEKILELKLAQDKHNSVVERVYKLESDQETLFHYKDDMSDQINALQKAEYRKDKNNER